MDSYRITALALGETIGSCVASLHVATTDADVVDHVLSLLSAPAIHRARDLAYFAAACLRRHHWNAAAYTVALRA